MKFCPTCQRRFPDLISMCPTDQSPLTAPPPAGSEIRPLVAAAPALAKEPPDTRTLEEKLFAPLPSKAPTVSTTPAPSKPQAVPAHKASRGSSTKMMETVFEEAPAQKSSRMAAAANAPALPWNKIVPAALALAVVIAAFVIFTKGNGPPTAAAEAGSSINARDVDMEINVRGTLSQSAALRNQDIQVRVKDGTVTLTGEASSAATIEQALKAARAIAGVRAVVNHLQVDPSAGIPSEGHAFNAGALLPGASPATNERGLAEQAKAHERVLAGNRAMSHGDYKSAVSFYRQALALNPNDSEAQLGYNQAAEKLQ